MTDSSPSREEISPVSAGEPSPRRWKWRDSQPLIAKIALELFVVFIGVSAAFAVENYRESRNEDKRREAVYRALDRELRQMAETHGPVFHRELTQQLENWDRSVARGKRPLPPAFRLPLAERPPTGVWDAAVATGSIELVEPKLFYELARFYNRADSVGNLYERYAIAAQSEVWPYLSDGPEAFWDGDGKLRPAVRAHVQRLRDFRERQGHLVQEARTLRGKIQFGERS